MKRASNKPAARTGGWKDLVLPAASCVCAVIILCAVTLPIAHSVALAANTPGYKAAPSPNALFVREVPVEPEAETVDLADYGGMPQQGDLYGTVSISGTAVSCNLYWGDSESELHAGAGSFPGGQIPGAGGVTLVGGHTGTFFRDLESVRLGADVTVETSYGTYHYTVTDMQVILAEEFGMEQLNAAPRNCIMLYTCYPFGQLTVTPQRYMVTAEYTSGPLVTDSTGGGAQ